MLGCQLRINNANNFVSDDPHVTFVNVGQVSGLGCVEDIPEAGWSDQVAVTSRNGYVVKSHKLDETTGLPVEKYARIFVVKYLLADNNGGIVGAVLKYQDNWEQNEPPTPPTPGPGGGSGTADDPYNVASGIALQGQEIVGWVQGYIVGAARNGLSTVSSNDDIIWSAPFDSYTNVLIADDPTCNEVSLCVIVNLPSGKPLRSQVNLFDNPDNLGKMLAVNGKLRLYFGQAGLRDSGGTENDFVLEGGITPPGVHDYTMLVLNELNGTEKFIELYNMGDLDLPLDGLYIEKDDKETPIWVSDNTIVVPAHGYVVLYSEDVAPDHPEIMGTNYVFNAGLSSKKALRIALFLADGTQLNIFTRCRVGGSWGEAMSNVAPLSYARTPDGGDWKLANSTPGAANPPTGDDIPQE